MWWKRKRAEGLLAASLYEELSAEERQELEKALAYSKTLRDDAEFLHGLVHAIPREAPRLGTDLTVSLHARIREAGAPAARLHIAKRTLSFAAAILILAAGAIVYISLPLGEPDPAGAIAGRPAPPTLMDQTLAKADSLLAAHQDAEAYRLLKAGFEGQPQDPRADEVLWKVASLAFDLGKYSEALQAHNQLRQAPYYAYLESSPERLQVANFRRDLLVEAEAANFRPLYDLVSAKNDREHTLARLEEVIVGNPEKLVADLAAEEMGRALIAESQQETGGAVAYLDAMKTARERCTNPYALALLDYKIGEIYRNEMRDANAAEVHFRKALENPQMARRAQDALGSLTPAAQ
ncbi:MAG: hypothetical protein IT365_20625 [Candidatus Hydrogenedentes bacterium]|nr:hypothetical protein [Candidatus Hydrogenedentota bacterium]